MDKKIKFSEQPTKVKIIYAVVIAILCITAVVVGIVSVASRKDETPDGSTPPVTDNGGDTNTDEGGDKLPDEGEDETKPPEKLTFTSPVIGDVSKFHSTETPVFSTTLNEWRVHTGIDISADLGTEVYAAASGTVTKVYNDPFLGKTVEITHDGGIVTSYSNLSSSDVLVSEGDTVTGGTKLGCIGDTSLTELAEEPHLHFGVKLDGVSVNPLDYISEESKEASLGIRDV